jgi:hypothetical protein
MCFLRTTGFLCLVVEGKVRDLKQDSKLLVWMKQSFEDWKGGLGGGGAVEWTAAHCQQDSGDISPTTVRTNNWNEPGSSSRKKPDKSPGQLTPDFGLRKP